MREILFRGKAKYGNGRWVYGSYLPKSETICTETLKDHSTLYADIFVIPETVGQFTGLTDKNGTKIFEGDIVRLYLRDYTEVCLIKWSDISARFGVISNDGGFCGIDNTDEFEVIGNIHDNPKLPKGEGK